MPVRIDKVASGNVVNHTHTVGDVQASGTPGTTTYLRGDGQWAIPSVGSVAWGAVTGTLSNQTDLQSALDTKVPYSGATTDLNLGTRGLLTNSITGQTGVTGSSLMMVGGTGTAGAGGDVEMDGGSGTTGGSAYLFGGSADLGSGGAGGSIGLQPGLGDGAGASGIIYLASADGTGQANLLTSSLTLARSFTFPDKTGTFAMTSDLSDYSLTTHNHDLTYEAKNANIQAHISSTANPHTTTLEQARTAGSTLSGQLDIANDTSLYFQANAGNGNSFKTGSDNNFLFDVGGNNSVKIKGGDSVGVEKLSYTNASWTDVWAVDTLGNVTQSGQLRATRLGANNTNPEQPIHATGEGASLGGIRIDNTAGGAALIANRTDGSAACLQGGASAATFAFTDNGYFSIVAYADANRSELLTGTFSGASMTNALVVDGTGQVGIGTATTLVGGLDVNSISGGVLTLRRVDTTVTSGDTVGKISFYAKDTQTTTNPLVAEIEAIAATTPTTDVNPGAIVFKTTGTAVGAGLTEVFRINSSNNVHFAEGRNISCGTTTGTKIGTSATQKIGFFNATPVVQPSAYTQTYSTATKSQNNPTSATLTNNTGGTVSTTLAAITAGATYAQADMTAVKNALASLADQVNKLRVDLVNAKGVSNAIIDDLQALGLAS